MASLKLLHEVTGCIFKQSDEKPAMKWSFLTKIKVEELASFLRNLKSSGIDQRAKEIGVLKTEDIARIKEVSYFIENCEIEVSGR